jgi:3'(2'), 5'-bisphosphate nucleotidase
MQKLELLELTLFLKNTAIAAGVKIMEIYADPNATSWQKADLTPLTEADLASNKCIMEALATQYPNIPYISEENKIPSYELRRNYEYYFLTDPIDGTKSFVKKTDAFSVNIALVHRDTVVAGCVFFPALKLIYYANCHSAAYRQSLPDGEIETIQCTPFHFKQRLLRVLSSVSHHNEKTQTYIDQLDQPQVRNVGASLKFIHVAEGLADIYPRFGSGMQEWDVAASQIIVEQAGGTVIDPNTQKQLKYNKPNLGVADFIASGKEI